MTIIIVANVIFCKQFAFKKEPQRSKSIEKITQSPIIIAFFTFFFVVPYQLPLVAWFYKDL